MSRRDDPQVILGASGPYRVLTEDDDPEFQPPPFLGFGYAIRQDTGEVVARVRFGEPKPIEQPFSWPPLMPLLWDGDQA